MRTSVPVTFVAAVILIIGVSRPASAQSPWSAMPGTCASTDNNFYSGTPSSSYPVARFMVPGGAYTFNAFHDGYIAFICQVDNPRSSLSTTGRWSQLQVARVRRAMVTALATGASRSGRITTSAASEDAVAPRAPMAMPTEAVASAGRACRAASDSCSASPAP